MRWSPRQGITGHGHLTGDAVTNGSPQAPALGVDHGKMLGAGEHIANDLAVDVTSGANDCHAPTFQRCVDSPE